MLISILAPACATRNSPSLSTTPCGNANANPWRNSFSVAVISRIRVSSDMNCSLSSRIMAGKPFTPLDALLRWINVILRALHLVAVILLGAALLGAPQVSPSVAVAVAATGFAMFALDFWRKPTFLREAAGVAVLVKLVLVAWMVFDAASRHVLFWLIVASSAISAHAPARFRHAPLFRDDTH